MLGGVSNFESVVAAVVPRGTRGGLVVDEDATTKGADGSGVIVEGAIEVLPG